MADVSVDASVSTATARGCRSVVFTTDLIGYVFYLDGSGIFSYSKTTDGGATWGAAIAVDGAAATTTVAFDVWFDRWTPADTGTLIHCWWFDVTNDLVRWRTLNTSGDTLGTVRTVFTGASAVAGRGAFVSGCKTRSGYLYCAYDLDAGAERGLHRSTDSGTTWVANLSTTFVEATLDTCSLFPASGTGDDNDCWALYYDASALALTLKLWDSSAVAQVESATIGVAHTDGATDLTGQYGYSGSVRHSDGHLIVAALSGRDVAASTHQVFDIASLAASNVLDSYLGTQDSSFDQWLGQSFVGNGTVLAGARFRLGKDAAFAGTVVTRIYAATGTHGSDAVPTGSSLAVSDAFNVSGVPTRPTTALQQFTFSGANRISLTAGVTYIAVIETTIVGGLSLLAGASSVAGHAGNGSFFDGPSGTWMAFGSDILFEITTIQGIATKTAIAASTDDHYYPQVCIDQNNNDLYVAYNGKRDGSEVLDTTTKVYYTKSTDGGATWSASDTAYMEGAAGVVAQVWTPLSGLRFYAVWRVGTTLVGNKVNSVSLPAGPASQSVTGAFLTSTSVVQSPQVVTPGAVTLTGTTLGSGAAVTAGTVSTAGVAQAVTGTTLASGAAVTAGTVAPGAVTTTGPTIGSGAQTFSGSVTAGAVTVTGTTLTSGVVVRAGSVSPGAVTVTAATLTSSALVRVGTITTTTAVTGTTLASTAILRVGTVTTTTAVSGATLAAGNSAFSGAVTTTTSVTGTTLASTLGLFPGAVSTTSAGAIDGAVILNSAILRPGIVTPGAVLVTGASRGTSAQLFPGVVAAAAVAVVTDEPFAWLM